MKLTNLILSILLMSYCGLSGQSLLLHNKNANGQGTYYGVITDNCTGSHVVGVTVEASGNQVFTTTTNDTGYYELLVDAGMYNVQFAKSGYDTLVVVDTTIAAGENIEINADITPALSPVVNVTATLNQNETACTVTWQMSPDGTTSEPNNGYGRGVVNFIIAKVSSFTPCSNPANGIITPYGPPDPNNTYDVSGWSAGYNAFAVKVVYECGESDWAYSNTFPLLLNNEIAFNIDLCNNSNLAGSDVFMIGRNCPWDSLQSVTDVDGVSRFDKVIKGLYHITISNPGYNTYELDTIPIIVDTSFNIELSQNVNPPQNLLVDSLTNIATWDEPTTTSTILGYYISLDGLIIDSTNVNELLYAFTGLTVGQTYNACVNAKYDCGISEQQCYSWESNVLSVYDVPDNNFIKVFPNPANNLLILNSTLPMGKISLANCFGQQVFSYSEEDDVYLEINTTNFKTGVYILKILINGKVVSKKIIIGR